MKLAWIIYDDEYETAEIVFTKPDRYCSGRVVPIVYAEIQEQT